MPRFQAKAEAAEHERALQLLHRLAHRELAVLQHPHALCAHHGTVQRASQHHAAPRHLAAYERLFECPVEFGADRNELVFDRKLLDEVPLQHDEIVWSTLSQRAEYA